MATIKFTISKNHRPKKMSHAYRAMMKRNAAKYGTNDGGRHYGK